MVLIQQLYKIIDTLPNQFTARDVKEEFKKQKIQANFDTISCKISALKKKVN